MKVSSSPVQDPWPIAAACSRLVGSYLGGAALVVTALLGFLAERLPETTLVRAAIAGALGALLGRCLGWIAGWTLARGSQDTASKEAEA